VADCDVLFTDLECHTISVMYEPVDPWEESGDSLKQVCVQDGTITSEDSEPNPSLLHEPVRLTASVRADHTEAGTPDGTVTFMESDGTVLGRADLDKFGNASATVEDLGVGRHTITAVYGGALHFHPSVSAPVIQEVLDHGPVTSFLVQAPRSVDAGSPFAVTVSARDRFGNRVTDYTGTVHATSSDPAAVLPKDYMFAAADKGTHVFTVTLFTGDVQIVTVRDVFNPSISGSAYIYVNGSTAVPRLRVNEIASSAVELGWTRSANDHYEVYRSLDGISFVLVSVLPASQPSYLDAGLEPRGYFYRVRAVNTDGSSAFSNIVLATVGPVLLDHSGGFADHSDLVANGSASFVGTAARLTDSFFQQGSFYALTYVSSRRFTTSFVFRLHEGTQPNPADGFTFILQNSAPDALGSLGGGLGYQGIPNSVCIKFDLFDNEGESNDSTGLFELGGFPGLDHNPGDRLVRLDPAIIDLRSQSMKRVDLSYDGTTLTETIADLFTGSTFTVSYDVDLAARLGGGAAYVGFTGGTGGLYTLQDILAWTFQSQSSDGDNRPSRPDGAGGGQTPLLIDWSWRSSTYLDPKAAIAPFSAVSVEAAPQNAALVDRLFAAHHQERHSTSRFRQNLRGEALLQFHESLGDQDRFLEALALLTART
jgi:hypothetical protein